MYNIRSYMEAEVYRHFVVFEMPEFIVIYTVLEVPTLIRRRQQFDKWFSDIFAEDLRQNDINTLIGYRSNIPCAVYKYTIINLCARFGD